MDSNNDSSHCRLCAGLKPNKKLINIHTNEDKRRDISEKLIRLNATADLYIETLPKTICLVCINALDRAYEFICGIEKAQEVLYDLATVKLIKKEATLSDNESLGFDANDDVKYEDSIEIKEELPKNECDSDGGPSNLKKSRQFPTKKQKRKPRNSINMSNSLDALDALPLAQLKLTWKDYSWTCAFCETQFQTIEELKTHSIEYHNCCNAYRCTDCNIRKLRLDSFMIHVKRHRKFLKLSCYKCFLKFKKPRDVNTHKKSHVTTSNICPGCNTCFPSAEDLNQHTTMYYKDRRARQIPLLDAVDCLTCLLCKKTFKNKGTLNTHLLTHTDRKRDHTCDKCGKCFFNKQNLAGHMLLHSEVRPYRCEICKFAFKTPQQLRNHVGVHDGQKPFSCDQCGRCFRLQKQLSSHRIIHTDLLPYVCSYCNKGFRFKTILNQHIRQHTGVKPYSCEICQRDFTNWPNYNKHMKRRHGLEMAKKKHTPEGVYPINPVTGEIIVYQETDKTLEWKKKMMTTRRPGRPKLNPTEETDVNLDCEEKPETRTVLDVQAL
ncbi:zinc finger protein 253-like [Ostrinia furnacalis]|uniref:zinc finger protein 253-like n=1 Tax=Ostrinia furnacalis TaxID=93504 RepID=UPI001039EA08|nr:zinc finger protein 253-like [Ostrinia furnacalis]